MNYSFEIKYSVSGVNYISTEKENGHYSLRLTEDKNRVLWSIVPKTEISLNKADLSFVYDFAETDKFFSNGYQSWTTSREYTRENRMKDITPIAKGKLRNLAGISADSRFVKTPTEPGKFVSHCYTYVKDENNRLKLFGSLNEKSGFTVFYADMTGGSLTVSKDIEGVAVNEEYSLLDMAVLEGGYDEVFDRYFEMMGVRKPVIDHLSGYTSWYNYFQKIDEKTMIRDLNALDFLKKSVSIFQIDDGYETFVGDWLDYNPKFPKGMGYIADSIHKKGYKAGIWLAPFNVQIKSRTYAEHPDWVIKDENGKPVLGCAGWGGAYTLDLYNEGAREYIKRFFNVVLNEWGYDMVKLDFLYSQCMYPRCGKSRGQIMCEAMDFLRECCKNKLILGCGVPLGAAFGRVDACRTGCDVDLTYKPKIYNVLGVNNEVPSAQNSINNAIFRRHLDGRVFCNDPDVFFLRYTNLKFTRDQKILLGGINHLFGNVLFVSDNAEEYKHDDVKLIEKFFSKSGAKIISADYATDEVIIIRAETDGREQTISLNIKTGESNMEDVLFKK